MSDNFTIDFDEILIETSFDDEEVSEEEEVIEFEPLQPIPTLTPSKMITPSPFPMREALTLVEEPEKLFDFSTTKLTPQQQMYIIQYATKGTKLGACKGAGVSYAVVEKWNENEEFRTALASAVGIAQDALEDELLRRAMNGSDRLMIEAIRANKPEKYGRRETKDVNVNGTVVHTWSDLAVQAKTVIESTAKEVVADNAPVVVDVSFEEVINGKDSK